jgi:hypothetical protein
MLGSNIEQVASKAFQMQTKSNLHFSSHNKIKSTNTNKAKKVLNEKHQGSLKGVYL